MFMIFKKKQMLIVTLAVLLAIAGYLNYRYDEKSDTKDVLSISDGETDHDVGEAVKVSGSENDEKSESDSFSSYRLERERARAKAREELEKAISNTAVSEESKKAAEQQLTRLSGYSDTETTAESVLKSKGFEDVVVFISGDAVNVTVKSDGLSSSDTAKIIDAVYELTKNNNIKIVEVE